MSDMLLRWNLPARIDGLMQRSAPHIKGFKLSVDPFLFNKVAQHIKESKQPLCCFNTDSFWGEGHSGQVGESKRRRPACRRRDAEGLKGLRKQAGGVERSEDGGRGWPEGASVSRCPSVSEGGTRLWRGGAGLQWSYWSKLENWGRDEEGGGRSGVGAGSKNQLVKDSSVSRRL